MSYIRFAVIALLSCDPALAVEVAQPDLPPPLLAERSLNNHLLVLKANSNLKIELANQRKWDSGNYEFNLRVGSSKRTIANTPPDLKEWDVALERPLRLPNKVFIDGDIGENSVSYAEYALGDARHEAGRMLLALWFTWQREQAQSELWQQQTDILRQQERMAEKRVRIGNAPKLELNQAQAAAAQAAVSWNQAKLRARLAGNELVRQFPDIRLPENLPAATPQALEHDLGYWKSAIIDHNHELAMARTQSKVQYLMARRSSADRIPDPTVGVRYSNEMAGNEKVAGVYISIPISFGQRGATSAAAAQQAIIAADEENFVMRRLTGDIEQAYLQATTSYVTWQQAHDAAVAMRNNAELTNKAYNLGESSLSDTLTARRLALESSMTELLAQLDANEARYRLLLDAHQLWEFDNK